MNTTIIRRSHEARRRGSRPVSPPFRRTRNKRPVVVVQADVYSQSLRTLLVAEVTKNLSMAIDPACLWIDGTPEGQATGVLQDSVVSRPPTATIKADLVDQVIAVLSDIMKRKLNTCQAALDLPERPGTGDRMQRTSGFFVVAAE